jgi:hypothetical protein
MFLEQPSSNSNSLAGVVALVCVCTYMYMYLTDTHRAHSIPCTSNGPMAGGPHAEAMEAPRNAVFDAIHTVLCTLYYRVHAAADLTQLFPNPKSDIPTESPWAC